MRKAPDSSFVYLLPTNVDSHLRISNVFSMAEGLGLKKTEDYFGTGFMYKLADTICASRAGVVYECNEEVKEGENAAVFFRRGCNKIAIQHKDGSLGNYEALAPILLLVKPGDYVCPGQPLAIFNKKSEKYTVLFSTFYLDEKKLLADKGDINTSSPSYFVYMPTHFYSIENDKSILLQANKEYKVHHPEEFIIAEMSKKEKKKRGYE